MQFFTKTVLIAKKYEFSIRINNRLWLQCKKLRNKNPVIFLSPIASTYLVFPFKPKIRYFLFQDNETAPFSPSRQPPTRPALVWAANNTTMSFGKVEKNMIFPWVFYLAKNKNNRVPDYIDIWTKFILFVSDACIYRFNIVFYT